MPIRKVKLLISVLFFVVSVNVKGQFMSRMTGEMISKEKNLQGQYALHTGTFFYDTQIKQLIYEMHFPLQETVVSYDTLIYYFRNNKLVSRLPNVALPEFSVFHLALLGKMKDFGLKNSQYTIEKIERERGRIYVTWKPVLAMSSLGKLVMAQRDNRLEGIVFFDKKGQPIARQLFRKYTTIAGVDMPQEVIMSSMKGQKPYYVVTTYKNIVVNDLKNVQKYRIDLPK